MPLFQDTVAAIATPPGQGGIGIVRVSGDSCADICLSLTGVLPEPNTAKYVSFISRDSTIIDKGIVIYFKAPHSYTGEDILECHAHGSNVVLETLLEEVFFLGARPARPGEFTERAFLNDKMDLVQAEAVADLIESKSKKAARSAIQSLEGMFSKRVDELRQQVFSSRALLEATLDFPEEGDVEIPLAPVIESINQAFEIVSELLLNAENGLALNNNSSVVLVGKPNVGKSSLLNYLSGHDAAIVSTQPGTTRDMVKQNVLLEGHVITLVDTAGIRETNNEVEQEGIARSLGTLKTADLVLHIFDSDHDLDTLKEHLSDETKTIHLRNKIDLEDKREVSKNKEVLAISAKTGEGIPALLEQIRDCLNVSEKDENLVFARKRHIDALQSAKKHLEQSLLLINNAEGQELVTESLRQALMCFDELTGKTTSEDVLGEIFSRFCIGK